MSHCLCDSVCFFHCPLCFGGSLVQTHGWGSPHGIPRMHRAYVLLDSVGFPRIEVIQGGISGRGSSGSKGSRMGKVGGRIWGAGRSPGWREHQPCVGVLREASSPRPGIHCWHAGHLGVWGQTPPPLRTALHNNSTYPPSKSSLGRPLLLFPLIVSLMTH